MIDRSFRFALLVSVFLAFLLFNGSPLRADTTAPAPPTDVSVAPLNDEDIEVTWTDNSDNEFEFWVEVLVEGVPQWMFADSAEPNASSASMTSYCSPFSVRVVAVNAEGERGESASMEASGFNCPTPLETPTNVSAVYAGETGTGLGYRFDVTWQDNSTQEGGYVLFYQIDGEAGTNVEHFDPNTEAATLSLNAPCETSISFWVQADSAGGAYSQSEATDPVAAITGDCPALPAAATNLRLVGEPIDYENLTLAWDDNADNEIYYHVDFSRDGGASWSESNTRLPPNTTSDFVYDWSAFECDDTIHLRVRAENRAGETISEVLGIAHPPCETPSAPTGLTATLQGYNEFAEGYDALFEWTYDGTGETTFEIWGSRSGGAHWSLLAYTTNPSDVNTVYCGTYVVHVFAERLGKRSAPSNLAALTVPCEGEAAEPVSAPDFTLGGLTGHGGVYRVPVSATHAGGNLDFLHIEYSQNGLHWSEGGYIYPVDGTGQKDQTLRGCETRFYIRVRAIGLDGSHAVSDNIEEVTTGPCPLAPPAPLNPRVEGFSESSEFPTLFFLDLAWDNPYYSGVSDESVASQHGSDYIAVDSGSPNIACGAEIAVQTLFESAPGAAAPAPLITAEAPDCILPPDVEPLTASTFSSSVVQLDWWGPEAYSAFFDTYNHVEIERSPNGTGDWEVIATEQLQSGPEEFFDVGLACDTTYYYRLFVAAGDSSPLGSLMRSSTPSNVASATTLPCPTAPTAQPQNLQASQVFTFESMYNDWQWYLPSSIGEGTVVELTWDANQADEYGYRVERSIDGGTTWDLADIASRHNPRAFDFFSQLVCVDVVSYRVRAERLGAYGPPSEVISINVDCAPPLSSPDGPVATGVDETSVDLLWYPGIEGSVANGFRVERSADGGATWVEAATLPDWKADRHTDTGLACATTYQYQVWAMLNGVDALTPSDTLTVTTAACTAPDGDPSGLAAEADGQSAIALSWADNATNEDAYRVERSPDGSTWSTLVTLPAGSTSTTDTGLSCDASFSYRVFAVLAGQDSAASNVAAATTASCLAGGDMEEDADGDGAPDGWTLVTEDGDGLFEHPIAYEGDSFVLLRADNRIEGIYQTAELRGEAGDTVALSLYYGGRKVASGGFIVAQVFLQDEGANVQARTCLITERGSFTWTALTCPITAEAPFDAVLVRIGWKGVSSGLLGIDAVTLTLE